MELPCTACKEQNDARPKRAEAGSGIPELGRKIREKVRGKETSVTKIPEIGRKRLYHGGTLRLRSGQASDTEKE
jgi:hypothetical protein